MTYKPCRNPPQHCRRSCPAHCQPLRNTCGSGYPAGAGGGSCAQPAYTFMANGHCVVQIDPITHQAQLVLELPCNVQALAADPQLRRLFFFCNNGHAGIFDLHTGAVCSLPKLCGCCAAVNPNNHKLYVATANSVAVLNGYSHEIIEKIPMAKPRDIAINPNSNLVYVAVDGGLSIINSNSDSIIGMIESDCALSAVQIDPCSNKIIVGESSGVGFIDANCHMLCELVPVPGGVRAMAVDSRLGLVYAVSAAGDRVFVLDICKRQVIGMLALPPCTCVTDLVVDPNNHLLYLATGNGLLIVDGGMNQVIRELPGVCGGGGMVSMACMGARPCPGCWC